MRILSLVRIKILFNVNNYKLYKVFNQTKDKISFKNLKRTFRFYKN